ncbi:DUF2167 domain-containing protein [Hymenobacter sp. CRA2]|uniref:DUF2167 domain-containing protein n=1 Tax=Hymenobacter sp. CRA2 TaxID=1955620 RepID=UPI0020C9D5A0|nr:DUF2167 domain-containing protein [Hymenobacter sp. CRA2]
MKQLLRILLCWLLAPALAATAATPPADSAALYKARLDSVNASFHYRTGRVELGDKLGTLTVPKGMRFLDAQQSRTVLVKLWGNPEAAAEGVEGMLFPADKGPVDDNGWAFVVSYEAMGYVKDDDAEDINYDELLSDMQAEIRESNPDRKAAGYPTRELLGWAVPPHYDKEAHALHWAKKIQFEDNSNPTLNYDVRLLGRKGVLSLNAVADPMQLALVQAQIPAVIEGTDFAQGSRYIDFDADVDEVAAYSLGGLVAGKVLAKVGFFALIAKFGKVIVLLLAKGWKLLILAAAGGIQALRRFFGGRSAAVATEPAAEVLPATDENPTAEV